MANRNRVYYQGVGVLVGPSPATGYHIGVRSSSSTPYTGVPTSVTADITGHLGDSTPSLTETGNLIRPLHRIQSVNHSFTVNRTDVNEIGQLASRDRVILETPTVSTDFTYLLANFANEDALGFDINGTQSAITNLINKGSDEKNYFIKVVPEGKDAIGGGIDPNIDVIGIGNGFITSYSSEASVGGFPSVSVSVEGLNMSFMTGASGNNIPAINPANGNEITVLGGDSVTRNITFDVPTILSNVSGIETGVAAISVLRPGDVTVSFAKNGGGSYDALGAKIEDANAKLQSYNLSFDLSRSPIEKLGSKFAFTREIDFPVNISLSVNAIVDNLRTGNLINILDCDEEYDVTITINNPDTCAGNGTTEVCKYILRKMTLDSQSYGLSVGDNQTVTCDFTSQLSGPSQTGVGLLMSGRSFDLGL